MTKKQQRICQPCTGCCDGWVRMVIEGEEVYPGRPCRHSTGQGCDDYERRPQDPCHDFNCGWVVADSPLPDWMKPNEAKVIVLFSKLNWRGMPVDLAVPVGKRIPPRALQWLKQFSERNLRPLIFTEQIESNGEFQKEQQLFVHGPPEFQQEFTQLQKSGAKLW